MVDLGELSQMGCDPPAVVERVDEATDTVAPGLLAGLAQHHQGVSDADISVVDAAVRT